MTFGYFTDDTTVPENRDNKAKFEAAAKKAGLHFRSLVEDNQPNRIDWKLRELPQLLNSMKEGDTLVSYEALNIARSTTQLLEIIEELAKRGIHLQLLKYNKTIHAKELIDTKTFLEFLKHAETEYEQKRQSDPIEKRNLSGVPLGRPKGRKNKSRKLDKHLPEIKKYLALKISKASIAKLIGCHAQTLYNYLEDKKLLDENEDDISSPDHKS